MLQPTRINSLKFFFRELRCFLVDWPAIIFVSAAISLAILYLRGDCLSELEKALCGGIVSSFVFYFFIDFLPKSSEKKRRLLTFSSELQKCLEYTSHIFTQIKSEWPNVVVDMNADQRFFQMLQTQTSQYMPTSNSLRRIKSTTNTVPIQFNYCNLGEVLGSEYERLKGKITHLDRVAAATQLESLDVESSLEIGIILDRKPFANMIGRLAHTGNTAAVFGTDLDLIFDGLIKIKKRLSDNFNVIWL